MIDTETLTTFRVIIRYIPKLIVVVGIICITYSFTGVFIKKKLAKYIVTALIIAIGLGVWDFYKGSKKIVRMKEDVLYIQPKK